MHHSGRHGNRHLELEIGARRVGPRPVGRRIAGTLNRTLQPAGDLLTAQSAARLARVLVALFGISEAVRLLEEVSALLDGGSAGELVDRARALLDSIRGNAGSGR